MLALKNLKNSKVVTVDGKDGYFVSIEKTKVLDNECIAIGFSGANTAKMYFIDYVKAFPEEFKADVKELFGIELIIWG